MPIFYFWYNLNMSKKSEIEVYVASIGQAPNINYVPDVLKSDLKKVKDKKIRLQKQALYNLIYYVFTQRLNIKLNKKSITKDHSGKPLIKNWHVSCSHSKDLICVAVSKKVNIGIDIEAMQTRISFERLKERTYHKNENKYHLNLLNLFYLWTRKEAIYKMNSKIGKFIPAKIDTTKYLTMSATLEYKKVQYALSVAAKVNEHVHINMLDKEIKFK